MSEVGRTLAGEAEEDDARQSCNVVLFEVIVDNFHINMKILHCIHNLTTKQAPGLRVIKSVISIS